MATRLTGNSPRRTRRRVRRGRAARGAVRGRGALSRHVSREASEPPDSEEEEDKEASEREASEVRLSTKRRRRIASQGASHRGLRPRPRGPGRQPPRGARGPRRRGRPPGHAARDPSGYEARQEARGDLPHSRCRRRRDIPVRDDVSQAKATKGAREAARGAREAARDAYGNCYCPPQWVPPFKQPILLPTFAASFLSLACAPFVEVAPLVDLTLAAAVSSVDNLQARHLGPSPPVVVSNPGGPGTSSSRLARGALQSSPPSRRCRSSSNAPCAPRVGSAGWGRQGPKRKSCVGAFVTTS